jgi:hypothetical protein
MKSIVLILVSLFFLQPFLFGQLPDKTLVDSIKSEPIKRPWVAIAEIMGTNIIINRFDANIRNVEWAKVTPKTWKTNMKAGFQTDFDYFTTNWLGHPYHGSLLYNAARSNGYNFWQSVPFTLGGSLMWEYFAETEVPSKYDIITTTLGGVYLGEMTHRIGEIFMHKIKKPGLKHTLTALVNPMSQINYLVVKESRQSKNDTTFNPLINGQFAMGGTFPFSNTNNTLAPGAYFGISMIYGDLFNKAKKGYKPFDYFTLNSWLNVSFKDSASIYFSILSGAPLFVKHLDKNSLLSISQQYDYLTSNVYKIGSIAVTGDYSFQHQWKKETYLATSVKAGFIILGSSQSEVVKYIYDSTYKFFFRDYIFGNGFTVKADILLKTKKFGNITGNINKWVIYAGDTRGIENLLLIIAGYDYPVWRKLNIGLQANYYMRKANYNQYPAFREIKKDYYDFRALVSLRF